MKTLLETPEQIWTALSSSHHLEATLLYHQAHVLHASLVKEGGMVEGMEVLNRQWEAICTFPKKIDTKSKEFLAQADRPPDQYLNTSFLLFFVSRFSWILCTFYG